MALLDPVRHRLAHFARAMAGDDEDAQDLISDTVLAAFERFETVRDHEAFLAYLFTIAARIHKRKRWRARLFGRYDHENASAMRDRGTPPDISADVCALYEALAQLPERQREAVALFEISGLTLEEIRSIQGGSLSAVKMRLVRGRKELARLLGVPERKGGEEEMAHGGARAEGSVGRNDRGEELLSRSLAYSEAHGHG